MRTLEDARTVCETYLPGLLADLATVPLAELEAPGNPAIAKFKAHGGPAMVIPKQYAGSGASALDAVRVTRALAAQAPSLAVATTMHHFSVATLFTLAESLIGTGIEWALLEGIATNNLLVSSGFAEGQPGQGILNPTMTATLADGGYLVNGSKKPCSLSRSMDLVTASVSIPGTGDTSEMGVMLLAATTPGISVHPFWASNILAGAESDEIRLTDVFVHESLMMRTELSSPGELDDLQTVGFIWFELLISSCYLGIASQLVQRVFDSGRSGYSELAAMGVRLETASMLLEGAARMLDSGERDNAALARTLMARYGVQDAIGDTVNLAVEALGGMSFIGGPDTAYLAAASHCLGFHPPSRASSAAGLAGYLVGDALRIS